MPNSGKARPPEDYSNYLETEKPLFIVGGQAVNLWALYYAGVADDYAPFVSRDIDVLGNRDTLREIAILVGLRPNFFPLKPPSNEVGYVAPKDEADEPFLIEVLKWVNGVTGDELMTDSVIIGIGSKKVPVRVPSPVMLLKAKLANLDSINQHGRQDAKHVYILFRLLPYYLNDLVASVEVGKRTEREIVNILGTLLDIVSEARNQTSIKKLQLDSAELFKELPKNGLAKITSFTKHQLKRVFPSG